MPRRSAICRVIEPAVEQVGYPPFVSMFHRPIRTMFACGSDSTNAPVAILGPSFAGWCNWQHACLWNTNLGFESLSRSWGPRRSLGSEAHPSAMTSTSSLPGMKTAGIVAVNVAPRPGSLVTPTSPPSSVARRLQIDRPRPEPRSSPTSPGRPSWTNSSKTRA